MATHPIDKLFATIAAREGGDAATSYTAALLKDGVGRCAKKFGEEAVEAVIAAAMKDKAALTAESADVLYHLLVLWAASGIAPADVYAALAARESRSGLAEKAARAKTR
ncbi:MAG TPA: phosphoribosyl-ATP diphosphatase [Rhizomicrobium sp.]